MGATVAEIAIVYNGEMGAQNQVQTPLGQRTSVRWRVRTRSVNLTFIVTAPRPDF